MNRIIKVPRQSEATGYLYRVADIKKQGARLQYCTGYLCTVLTLLYESVLLRALWKLDEVQ